ncbi:MAG: hypothetical protein PHU27_04055 [Salinivirgaceae bacterium]|nr:hypothetical protein [Salinivirgaceae bacterium]
MKRYQKRVMRNKLKAFYKLTEELKIDTIDIQEVTLITLANNLKRFTGH